MDVQLISVLLLIFLESIFGDTNLARGWGDNINWFTFDDAMKDSKTSHKPVMLIIHKSWCGACKVLKEEFSSSDDIREMSKAFIMTNTQDEEEPSGAEYQPDGSYIPRILFIDVNGKVRGDIINDGGNEQYKYFYFKAHDVLNSMKSALTKLQPERPPGADEL